MCFRACPVPAFVVGLPCWFSCGYDITGDGKREKCICYLWSVSETASRGLNGMAKGKVQREKCKEVLIINA